MNFNFFNTLILVGTIQGFIFGGAVLFLKKYRSRENYFLVTLIFAVSLNNLQYYLRDINYWSYRELMNSYYLPYASLNCTFLYLYVMALIDPERKISIKNRMLFLPFIFFLIATTVFKILIFNNPNTSILENRYLNFANVHEFFAVVYSMALVGFAYKVILKHERKSTVFHRAIIHQKLKWLKVTLLLLFVVILVYAYLMVRVILYPDVLISFYALWIGNSFMIYWLGHIGIYKYGIYKERKQIRKISKEISIKPMIPKPKNKTIVALEHLLNTEKRYLDANLNLDSIALELDVSSGHLSRIINSELQIGFSEYINSLRVEEAKSHLLNSDFENYTLAAIGLESGFNSKSTFFSTFKKCTGLTPLQFKNNSIN